MTYTFSPTRYKPISLVRYFTVPRRHMAYLKFVMEAYEGLATLSTADKLNCIVRVSWDSSSTPALEGLLRALQQEIELVETPPLPEEEAGAQQPDRV